MAEGAPAADESVIGHQLPLHRRVYPDMSGGWGMPTTAMN